MDGIRSVLIIKPSSLGDIVHTLPAIHFLKRAYPHLELTWLVKNEWAPLLAGNSDLTRLVLFPRNEFRGFSKFAKIPAWLQQIGQLKPDLVLDFQGLMRTAAISRLCGARRVHCMSDAEITPRVFAHHVVPVTPREQHAVERYLRLVADVGVPVDGRMEFPLPQGERPKGMPLEAGYLLLHPFSRGAGKSLSDICLKKFCEAMAPFPIVVAGRTAKPHALPAHCIDLSNQTSLTELIWLIRHARFVVSVDSGPMHIAAAMTDQLLGIHTWTDPRIIGPYNANAWVWKAGQIMQVKDLAAMPEKVALTEQAFRREDVDGLAEFVRMRLKEGDA